MDIFSKFRWFNTHFLGKIWIVGIIAIIILSVFFIADKIEDRKYLKQEEMKKMKMIENKKREKDGKRL